MFPILGAIVLPVVSGHMWWNSTHHENWWWHIYTYGRWMFFDLRKYVYLLVFIWFLIFCPPPTLLPFLAPPLAQPLLFHLGVPSLFVCVCVRACVVLTKERFSKIIKTVPQTKLYWGKMMRGMSGYKDGKILKDNHQRAHEFPFYMSGSSLK